MKIPARLLYYGSWKLSIQHERRPALFPVDALIGVSGMSDMKPTYEELLLRVITRKREAGKRSLQTWVSGPLRISLPE